MRLYTFLLFALFALAAHAATIPDNVASEKKINAAPEIAVKAPENVSSEQELIDQSNTINDVDNKLRTKPEDIPVEVILENVALKTVEQDESEEIVRPSVDLRNPGPPQRQEHETQNPESFGAEQQLVQIYKQNLNGVQASLKQGLKSVGENVQNMINNNEQINLIQQSIQTLRENFMAQINKLNSTVQYYLHADNTNASPTEQQTKASNVHTVEIGLKALKNDFNRGLQTLTDGVQVYAALRAENENPEENKPSSGSSPAPANPAPVGPDNPIFNLFINWRDQVQGGINNLTSTITNFVSNRFPGSTAAPAAAAPAGVQSDTPVSPATPNWPSFWPQSGQSNFPPNSITDSFNNLMQNFYNIFNPTTAATPVKTSEATTATDQKPSDDKKPESKPDETAQPAKPAETNNADGPIRQILQNNPITQGIANAVQRLQNINNPDKPRDTEKEKDGEQPTKADQEPAKVDEEPAKVDDKPKGHPPAVRDNSNVDSSGVEASEPVKEVQNETVPESQEPKKEEEIKEQKTEEVVEKTE